MEGLAFISIPARAPINDEVKNHPHAGDPVPVDGRERDIESFLFIQWMRENIRSNHGKFRIQCQQVKKMHAQDHPGDGAIRILIPPEMQTGKLVESQYD